jgi:AraC family transcriptional regulator of arabinose operon
MNRTEKREGFEGQIQYVIPRPILTVAAQHILVSGLYPTDIGWYPSAKQHSRQREKGAEQNILIICTGGQGWFEMDGRRRTLRKNQALLVPKDKPHTYGASQRDPWTIQWVHFVGEDASYYLTLLDGGFTLNLHPDLTSKIDGLFAEAYESLARGFSQQSIICSAQIVRHILGSLFFNNKAFAAHKKPALYRSVENTIRFMRKNIDGTLTISQMAAQAGLSPAHFSRLFSKAAGFSPMEYFIHLKIQRACRFLTLTTWSIKEISSRLGYSDQYYFSRVFHKVMGIPPAAYRRNQAG